MSPKKRTSSIAGRGRGHDRSHSRSSRIGVKPIDFDSTQYNNLSFKLFLVFPGDHKLTMAFSPYTIKPNVFVSGVNHESGNKTVKQAIYDILVNSIS